MFFKSCNLTSIFLTRSRPHQAHSFVREAKPNNTMISNRIIRFALIYASSSLLYITPGRASPTSSSSTSLAAFAFPSCVESCINVSGCGTDNPQCMCKFSGKGIFLELALTCMSYYCEAELRRADDTLIDIMEAGCRSIRQPIPEEKLEMAEAWASRLVKNLPPSTTIATTTVHQPLPTTLVTVQPPPPVTATTTHVPPPATTTEPTVVPTTLESSSSTSTSPSDAATSTIESSSSSSTSSVTTLQPQTSSTKPADEATTSALPPKPRPDSSPYGPFVGPIPSSAVRGVMVSLPLLHWASVLVCMAVAGVVFA